MSQQVASIREEKPTTDRRPIYTDLESLLSPGFLTHSVELGGMIMSVRTLFPGDLFLLQQRVGPRPTDRAWKAWLVSSSIWMVDGQPLLGQPHATYQVYQSIRSLPNTALDVLFSLFTGLFNRAKKATRLLEAFCYEDFSRSMWRMSGRQSLAREEYAGIPGVSSLGSTSIQRAWMAFNLMEDEKEDNLQAWTNAKFIASAHSPKGVRKLNSHDSSTAKLEAERRERVIWESWAEVTRGIVRAPQNVVHRSVTGDELSREMQMAMSGEKDLHDLVIDAYKEKIRRMHDDSKQQHQERMEELQQIQAESGFGSEQPLRMVGYTREQLLEITGQVDVPSRPGVRRVFDTGSSGRLYERYVEQPIQAGVLNKEGKGVAAPGRPLNAELENRKVRFSLDGPPTEDGEGS